jgi:uncharacterized membrane protein (UPF0127 family)
MVRLSKRVIIGVTIIAALVASIGAAYYYFDQPKTVRIRFDGVTLMVELSTTPAAQQLGLSDRDSMPDDHGMLFIFSQESQWSFWMHEMRFPLDIIWFNAARQVVFIEQNLPPCTPTGCPVYTPTANAMYVLEVNAGFVANHSVRLGDRFSFI